MSYQRKTDNPNAGRPPGPPKATLTLRVPVEVMQTLNQHRNPRQVAVQALRVGLGQSAKFRSIG